MSSAKPVIHGRDHHHGGADPIANFIEYDYLNVGDWLNIVTTGDDGITVTTQGNGNVAITAAASMFLTGGGVTISNQYGAGTGLLTVEDFFLGMNFSGGFTAFSVAGFNVDSTLGILLTDSSTAGAGALELVSDLNYVRLLAGSDHGHTHIAGDVAIEADARINLYDHGGGINIESVGGAGIVLNAKSAVGVSYPGGGTRPIIINSTGSEGGTTGATVLVGIADGDLFEIFRNDTLASLMSVSTAGVQMHTLPTSNPGGSGLLWNSGGTVKIT